MAAPGIIRSLSRRDPAVVEVLRNWRRLTGGSRVPDSDRPTVIACSGGADSSALALALACAKVRARLIIAHVVHDLRPVSESLADRDAARRLAEHLDLPFAETAVEVRSQPGNREATARRERYRALAAIARHHSCGAVVTAHHADDQLETMLMRLLRGGGAAGLAGMRDARELARGLTLIRPMLGITRADCRRLCTSAGWEWCEDLTNRDTGRVRAAIRHNVLPALERIRPDAAQRASSAARLLRDASDVINDLARAVVARAKPTESGDGLTWDRRALRQDPAVVLGEVIRAATLRVAGRRGADRLGQREILAAVRSIQGSGDAPKTFAWSNVSLEVSARNVRLTRSANGC